MLKLGGEYSDDALKAIARLGDDLAEAGVKLSDEAAEGLGRIFRQAGDDAGERLVRAIGTDNPNLLKVLENAKAWDDVAAEGFGKLVKAGVDDKTLTNFLVKYADDSATSNNVLTILGKDPTKSAELLNRYGDDAVELVGRYGDDGFQALVKYKDQAVDLLKKHGDKELGPYLKSVTDPVKVVDLEKTPVTLIHGFEVSDLARPQAYDVDIYISGKWADTPAEKALREEAWGKALSKMDDYFNDESLLPEDVRNILQDVRKNPGKYNIEPGKLDEEIEEIKKFAAQREVAKEYTDLNWPQVKRSTGASEVDVFIDIDEWNRLTEAQQKEIGDELMDIFGVGKVDFYQEIKRPLWMELLSDLDPAKTIPPGSIGFLSDGTIIHQLLGGL